MLVRRDGDQVLFLNELRHRKNTALLLRLPLANTVLARVQTAAGSQAEEARDYRGMSVLAAAREVPGTSWMLVAKKDLDEIYAPLRKVALTNASIVLLLLAGAGAGATLLWWQ